MAKFMGEVFRAASSKDMAQTIENIEKCKTTSISTMSDRIEPAGFTHLSIMNNEFFSEARTERIREILNYRIRNKVFEKIDQRIKDQIVEDVMTYLMCDADAPTLIKNADFNFVSGDGWLVIYQMCFQPISEKPGYTRFGFKMVKSSFVPAQPYVVITHSKNNLFHHKVWSEIQYLPAVVTEQHIKTVCQATIAMIAGADLDLPPLLT